MSLSSETDQEDAKDISNTQDGVKIESISELMQWCFNEIDKEDIDTVLLRYDEEDIKYRMDDIIQDLTKIRKSHRNDKFNDTNSIAAPQDRSFQFLEDIQLLQSLFPDIVHSVLVKTHHDNFNCLEMTAEVLSQMNATDDAEVETKEKNGESPINSEGQSEPFKSISPSRDSDLAVLIDMFPSVPVSKLESILHNSSSVQEAIDGVLASSFAERKQKNGGNRSSSKTINPQLNPEITTLIEMFAELSVSVVEKVYGSSKNIEGAIQRLLEIEKQPKCDGSCIRSGFPCLIHSSETDNPSSLQSSFAWENSNSTDNISTPGWSSSSSSIKFINPQQSRRHITARTKNVTATSKPIRLQPKEAPFSQHKSSSTQQHNDTSHFLFDSIQPNPDIYRREAIFWYEKRHDCFEKASSAIKTKDGVKLGGSRGLSGAVALWFSQEGHKIKAKIQEYEVKAALASIKRKQTSTGKHNEIDLHGLVAWQAEKVIQEFIPYWYHKNTIKSATPSCPLTIVVGLGTHSTNGQQRLYKVVKNYLDENGSWKYQDYGGTKGVVVVYGKKK
ncbi:hypothetical protein BKA69DRAFT_623591 [Paraphysoderma sedebokerense]|nr:hypothetical protein BKA69DRAFT_623591 [Paraphysoderma sedebokerense]